MKTLIIEESKWLHGNKWKTLLSVNGKMCCLGFLAKSCGASDEEITLRATPEGTPSVNWHPALLTQSERTKSLIDSPLCCKIIITNDEHETTDCEFDPKKLEQKKQKLTQLFKELDIELQFVP